MAERLKASQDARDLQHYNDRFDSFKQVSKSEEQLKGRGNDKKIQSQVKVMVDKVKGPLEPIVMPAPDWGGAQYAPQSEQEDRWEQ